MLATIKFYLQCHIFTLSTGEEVWCSMGPARSYRECAVDRRWLERADDPLVFRIRAITIGQA